MIDIHAHTSKHLLNGLHTKNATIENIEYFALKYKIQKIYLMATYFPLKGTGVKNSDLIDRIKNNPLFGCFGSLNMETMNEFNELEMYIKSGLIDGIKLLPGYQNIILSDSKFDCIYKLAQNNNIPIAIHTGILHPCCSKLNYLRCNLKKCVLSDRQQLSNPKQIREIAIKFPKVKFLAAHLSNPFFNELRNVMIECPNVFTDVSGLFVSGTEEDTFEYRQLLKNEIMKFISINSNRIIFGTDFPIQSYEDSIDLIKSLNITSAYKNKIFIENAQFLLKGAL